MVFQKLVCIRFNIYYFFYTSNCSENLGRLSRNSYITMVLVFKAIEKLTHKKFICMKYIHVRNVNRKCHLQNTYSGDPTACVHTDTHTK